MLSPRGSSHSADASPASTVKRTPSGIALTNKIREMVSLNKNRLREEDFDLDLTYITPQIVAMGFPSSDIEGIYRNPMSEVQRFVESKHSNHYMIYNLCSERDYDVMHFHGRVENYPFPDHNPPPIQMMLMFAKNVYNFLSRDPKNTAFIHCKAGKGRTGTMICILLLYSGMFDDVDAALDFYANKRTKDGKGVTIPSQRRYVRYFGERLKALGGREGIIANRIQMLVPEPQPRLILQRIVVTSIQPGIVVSLVIRRPGKWVFIEDPRKTKKDELFERDCKNTEVIGDIDIHCHNEKKMDKSIWHFWFNTSFIRDNYLCLTRNEVDGAHKKKNAKLFPEDFKIELFFSQ